MRCVQGMRSALVLAFTCAPALQAGAAMVSVPIEESIAASDLVIHARSVDRWCEWDGGGKWIFTFVRVQVLEEMGGQAGGGEVVVRVPGGEIGGIGLRVSDMPEFETGEESVLFLRRSEGGGVYSVVDGFQGKTTLREGTAVERDLPAPVFLDRVRVLARESFGRRGR